MDSSKSLNWNKAGLSQVDKERVNNIVESFSNNNPYGDNLERKKELVSARAKKFQEKAFNLTKREIESAATAFDSNKLAEWQQEANNTPTRWWALVDLDAFFCAVETLKNPSLNNIPFVVAQIGGVVTTGNYKSRKYGVRSGLATHIAQGLCPNLTVLHPDFESYTHYSALTRVVFAKYDPKFISMSLDEAYLDITDIVEKEFIDRMYDSTNPENHVNVVQSILQSIREDVQKSTGLTCSIGASTVPMISKILADVAKPNGQAIILPGRKAARSYLSSLSLRKLGGIGAATADLLSRPPFSMTTCKQLIDKRGLLYKIGTPSMVMLVRDCLALNNDIGYASFHDAGSDSTEQMKSIGNERTFTPTSDRHVLMGEVQSLVESVWKRMEHVNYTANFLNAKLKTSDFKIRSYGFPPSQIIDSKEKLSMYAIEAVDVLLKRAGFIDKGDKISVRLIGIRTSDFNIPKYTVSN